VCLCDFGIADLLGPLKGVNESSSHVPYLAPEILQSLAMDTKPADSTNRFPIIHGIHFFILVWAFGMLIYELLTWSIPNTVAERPVVPNHIQNNAKFRVILNIFNQCTIQEADQRPTASDLQTMLDSLCKFELMMKPLIIE
jgi:serine/threonine protein kinase